MPVSEKRSPLKSRAQRERLRRRGKDGRRPNGYLSYWVFGGPLFRPPPPSL